MRELSLHILDIAENSMSAQAKNITLDVVEDTKHDLLQIIIEDDGKGMDEEMIARVVDPFVTSRTTRKVGLGIPLLKAAAEGCNGFLKIASEVGKGTRLTVQFQRSHIDRMPMGDLITTIMNLVIANPQVHWLFEYQFNGKSFVFDDEPIKVELGDVHMSDPIILKWMRDTLETGMRECQPEFKSDQVTLSY